ncbi:MAG: trehalose-phosphatase [Bauldia sp.]
MPQPVHQSSVIDLHQAVAADGEHLRLPSSAAGYAFFFDLDGTLIDIAPTPGSVIVPESLASDLMALERSAGGALAVVSGRSIATIDQLLVPARFAAAGLHGGELRLPGGSVTAEPPPPALRALLPDLEALVSRWPGAMLEDKGAAIAVHYRNNPAAEGDVVATVGALLPRAEGTLAAQHGKMVVELKPAHAGKGEAVRRLMEGSPFAGRRPIAIGDDVTDEDMFNAVNAAGGISVRVGPRDRPTAARYQMHDTAAVRAWIGAFD